MDLVEKIRSINPNILSTKLTEAYSRPIAYGNDKGYITHGTITIRYIGDYSTGDVFEIKDTSIAQPAQINRNRDGNISIRYPKSDDDDEFGPWIPILTKKLELTPKPWFRWGRHTPFTQPAAYAYGGKRKYKHKRTRRGKRRTTRKR